MQNEIDMDKLKFLIVKMNRYEICWWVVFGVFCLSDFFIYFCENNGCYEVYVRSIFRLTFYSCFRESFNGEYHMHQIIPLHSCDYLCKVSIKINVATDESNSRNEI